MPHVAVAGLECDLGTLILAVQTASAFSDLRPTASVTLLERSSLDLKLFADFGLLAGGKGVHKITTLTR